MSSLSIPITLSGRIHKADSEDGRRNDGSDQGIGRRRCSQQELIGTAEAHKAHRISTHWTVGAAFCADVIDSVRLPECSDGAGLSFLNMPSGQKWACRVDAWLA